MSGYPSQTRLFRSGGSIRSHSTSELLLEAKDQASSFREGLLRTTRQAAQMTNLGLMNWDESREGEENRGAWVRPHSAESMVHNVKKQDARQALPIQNVELRVHLC